MSEIEVPFADLQPDPNNVRGVYRNIDALAESIRQHGLLQNLVVREEEEHFLIVAGNRRYQALKKLVEAGKWSRLVRCLLIDGKGDFEQLTENTTQEAVHTWRLGYRYQSLIEAGYTQYEIAGRIGRTQSHVSIATQIAHGLDSEVVARCERLPAGYIANNQLLRLAKLYNPQDDEPLKQEQLHLLEQLLEAKRKGKPTPRKHCKPRREREIVWRRFRRLQENYKRLPPVPSAYVQAVLRYLIGKDRKLKFQ